MVAAGFCAPSFTPRAASSKSCCRRSCLAPGTAARGPFGPGQDSRDGILGREAAGCRLTLAPRPAPWRPPGALRGPARPRGGWAPAWGERRAGRRAGRPGPQPRPPAAPGRGGCGAGPERGRAPPAGLRGAGAAPGGGGPAPAANGAPAAAEAPPGGKPGEGEPSLAATLRPPPLHIIWDLGLSARPCSLRYTCTPAPGFHAGDARQDPRHQKPTAGPLLPKTPRPRSCGALL